MKRFYKVVTIEKKLDVYEIHLDGKPVKTPAGVALAAPNENLAHAIMNEWAAQDTDIVPDSMPLSQLLITAQDRVASDRASIEKTVQGFLNTDLLCYRATLPAAIATRQADMWNPWLAWFEKTYGVPLETTTGLRAIEQSPEAHKAVASAIKGMSDLSFTAFQSVVSLCGSVVLGLAFVTDSASSEDVFAAAHVEEAFKAEFYNEDKHGIAPNEEKRRTFMQRDLLAAKDFLRQL